MPSQFIWDYDRSEILADGIVHVLGIVMATIGAAVLMVMTVPSSDIVRLAAVTVYLIGLLAMFCSSAAYNLWPVSPFKWRLRQLDQSAIYLLIAATYTAFMLPTYGAFSVVLAVVWGAALVGMAIKLFWPGYLDRASVVLYLAVGWSGIFTMGPIAAALAPITLWLVVAGGVLYSVGVVFHLWSRLRFQNAIWHGFVLTAATFHYAAVLTSLG